MGAAFDWVRRMGKHEAYHLAPVNRLVHWLCIPIELAMAAKLLTLVPLGPIDLAALAIVALAVIYLATDLFAGALMTAFLVGLRSLAFSWSTGSRSVDAVVAIVVFVIAFSVQTRIGHGVYERGIDDTNDNLAELRRTKNPIPILLVFYFHLVELLFAAGYRPTLRAEMEGHRADELARLDRPLPSAPRP